MKKIRSCRAKLDAALERATVAAVPGMMNDTHVGQLLDEPVADLARAIFVAVIISRSAVGVGAAFVELESAIRAVSAKSAKFAVS